MYKIGVNINQIAKKVNSTSNLYLQHISDIEASINAADQRIMKISNHLTTQEFIQKHGEYHSAEFYSTAQCSRDEIPVSGKEATL